MKAVLFVDDDENVLSGLRRMLRGFRDQWVMDFVASGAEALHYLAQREADVVVTDLRMPGMNGLELLKHLNSHYPHIVRIILSGQSDEESTIRAAGVAHQYLSKPCDTETLKATIVRCCALQDRLSNQSLKNIVAGMNSLPSPSTHYQELLWTLNLPEPSMRDISEIVAQDAAMTAKVIHLVNTSFFGLQRRITDPFEAMTYLGLKTVRALVLSAGVFSQFEGAIGREFVDTFMEHSLAVAGLAKQMATDVRADVQFENDVHLAGLLNDVGKLILAENFTTRYAALLERHNGFGHDLCEEERQEFGADHAALGAYLMALWGLPSTVVEAIAFHHQPATCRIKTFSAVAAVHIADVFANSRERPESTPNGQLDYGYLTEIGIAGKLDRWEADSLSPQAVSVT